MWIVLQKGNLESLLDRAKELEKKYEWLQAAEFYKKAADLVLAENDLFKAADLNEKMGFCYYRAALQAQSNIEFRKTLKSSIKAYQEESKLLGGIENEECHIKRIHADALTAFVKSSYEKDLKAIKRLQDKWWTLENQVVKAYERSDDLHSAGRICNDLLEYSTFDRYWLASTFKEHNEIRKESLVLTEKAIRIFSDLDDKYELSRAYLYMVWYYGFAEYYEEDENKLIKIGQKCQQMLNKALKLSKEIGDALLISRYYHAAWGVANNLKFDPSTAVELGKKMIEYGNVAKDNYIIGIGNALTSASLIIQTDASVDPDKTKKLHEKAMKMAQKAEHYFQIINYIGGFYISYRAQIWHLSILAFSETDLIKRKRLYRKAIEVGQEGLERLEAWKRLSGDLFADLSHIIIFLSSTTSNLQEKNELLRKAQSFASKYFAYAQEMEIPASTAFTQNLIISDIQSGLASIEQNRTKKISLLRKALVSHRKAIEALKKKEKFYTQSRSQTGFRFGGSYKGHGQILHQIYSLTKEKKILRKAIEAFKQALFYFRKADLPTYMAETYWHLAQLHDQAGEFQEASQNYQAASQEYDCASQKIPQLRNFYREHSLYMQAWSQIEHARHSHSLENYEEAIQHYEKAAKLHEATSSWNYLTFNYLAWANMEEAESLSRNENTQQAKQTFQKAHKQFFNAEESFKQKLEEITSEDEKEMTQELLKASDLRRKYCQARILMEEAKLLDRKGRYLQSSKNYGEAAQKITSIIENIDEAERKELKYMAILCQAWEKMANAEETSSSESYLEAAELFEQAKEHCYTRKASLWALGNSNFCKGLAAGVQYQTDLELEKHAKAKGFMKSASTNYSKAGFKAASEYAKATQRLFDAYAFMNQAENELDQEKRAKQYQMAENLLQIAAVSFMKAKQPEKTAQVQEILSSVREEKTLAISLSQVMKAPTIASSTRSFTAPSPSSEVSVGLEQFEHANVQANLIANISEVKVGESFCLAVEFVNAGREPALLMKVDDFVPSDFVVVKKPEIYLIEKTCLNMKGKQLPPLKLVEVKLTVQPSKKGNYTLNPRVYYLDERGQNKTLQLKTLEIQVEEVLLEDRVSTGTIELDSLLLGGIPEEYAVVLSGPPCDEREKIINNFLEAGIKEGVSFYVTTEANELLDLLENPNFFLFLCNPKPKVEVPDLLNVFKLRGKTDLNNLGIALVKAYRSLDQDLGQPKRICVEILSDVLEDYGSKTTRKWISDLITNYGAKGFTMLAVMNPDMHPSDQATAVIDLFDGEIELIETEDSLECKKSIRVRKLRNQDYIKNPICLTNPI